MNAPLSLNAMESSQNTPTVNNGEKTAPRGSFLTGSQALSNSYTSISLDQDSSYASLSRQSEQHSPPVHENIPFNEHNHKVAATREHQFHSPTSRPFRKDLWAWKGEIIWCILSILTLYLIIAMLYWRKDKRVPKWYAGLTVNTIIALLSTLCRAMTIIPISEGISQSKWNWLVRGKRPLMDLDVFDQASRGPWGSIGMVYTARGQTYAVIAAVTLITGLATSTMTQAAISIDEKLVRNANGTAITYQRKDLTFNNPGNSNGWEFSEYIRVSEMERAGLQSFLGPSDRDWPPYQEPVCTSSECQWSSFESLGVCFTMRNATEYLTFKSKKSDSGSIHEASILNGNGTSLKYDTGVSPSHSDFYNMAANFTTVDAEPKDQWPQERKTAAFENEYSLLNATILQLYIIYGYIPSSKFDDYPVFRAIEILWHYCVQTYDVKVEEGASYTQMSGSHTEVRHMEIGAYEEYEDLKKHSLLMTLVNSNRTQNFPVYLETSKHPNLALTIINSEEEYDIPDPTVSIGNLFLRKIQEGLLAYTSDSVFEETSESIDMSRWKVIERTGIAVSRSMSNLYEQMRDYGEVHAGDALTLTPFIRVTWAWLVFLAAQIALTWIFLIMVIFDTARLGVEIVKSSQAASLFAINHSFTNNQDSPGDDYESILRPGLRRQVEKNIRGMIHLSDNRWTIAIDLEDSHRCLSRTLHKGRRLKELP